MNNEYPYTLDNTVNEELRQDGWLGAWDALHELVQAIRDRPVPLIAARPNLERALLSLLKHLVDADAYLAVDPHFTRRIILGRLRKPSALEDVLDEFLALVHDILAPMRFHAYLGGERQRLSSYLEAIAWDRLEDSSATAGTVDDVFADLLDKAHQTRSWVLPEGIEWKHDLAIRVDNKAHNRAGRRHRRAAWLVSSNDPDAFPSRPGADRIDTPRTIDSPQEAAVIFKEQFEHLSTGEQDACVLDVQGFTDEEISRKLGTPLRTVQRMLQRIRGLLREGYA